MGLPRFRHIADGGDANGSHCDLRFFFSKINISGIFFANLAQEVARSKPEILTRRFAKIAIDNEIH